MRSFCLTQMRVHASHSSLGNGFRDEKGMDEKHKLNVGLLSVHLSQHIMPTMILSVHMATLMPVQKSPGTQCRCTLRHSGTLQFRGHKSRAHCKTVHEEHPHKGRNYNESTWQR